MRISDWSSDVCSSDLQRCEGPDEKGHDLFLAVLPKRFEGGDQDDNDIGIFDGDTDGSGHVSIGSAAKRSEEHTSELQSLMRISYAVFCLKKKKDTTTNQAININTIFKTAHIAN